MKMVTITRNAESLELVARRNEFFLKGMWPLICA